MFKFRSLIVLAAAAVTSACVSAGYEGQVGSISSADQISDQRAAHQAISVFEEVPSNYSLVGTTSVRRCHRSFTEEPPSVAAFRNDLVLAAYAQGADAISNIRIERMNGLLANCWYVEEATADVYRKGR